MYSLPEKNVSRLINFVILKFPSKARPVCFKGKCYIFTVFFIYFFQQENHNDLLLFRIFIIISNHINPGILFAVFSDVKWQSHCRDPWWKNSYDTVPQCIEFSCEIKLALFFYVFSLRTTCSYRPTYCLHW